MNETSSLIDLPIDLIEMIALQSYPVFLILKDYSLYLREMLINEWYQQKLINTFWLKLEENKENDKRILYYNRNTHLLDSPLRDLKGIISIPAVLNERPVFKTKIWYKNGKIHRNEYGYEGYKLPAKIISSGWRMCDLINFEEEWWNDGLLHRDETDKNGEMLPAIKKYKEKIVTYEWWENGIIKNKKINLYN